MKFDKLEVSVVGLSAGLVEPTLADVAHPLHHVMVAVVELGLKHLEIAHLQARASKWNLERGRERYTERRRERD